MPGLSPETAQMLGSYMPLLLMAFIFYFLLYRPQKKEQKKRSQMLDSLKRGDKVITLGGIYGVIIAITEKKVTLRVAEKVEIEVLRSAISGPQNQD